MLFIYVIYIYSIPPVYPTCAPCGLIPEVVSYTYCCSTFISNSINMAL